MLTRGQRLYIAFACVSIGAVVVVLYALLAAPELFQPGPLDWMVAGMRLVECCVLFYGVTYLAARRIYWRIDAERELAYVHMLSADNQIWLNSMTALVLLCAQCTLAFRAGAVEVSHVLWVAVAGGLLIHTLHKVVLDDERAIDLLFSAEAAGMPRE